MRTVSISLIVILSCCSVANQSNASSVDAITSHPNLMRNGGPVAKQLGDFGESFIAAEMRARGFHVFDGNMGGKGIDLLAAKPLPGGSFTDLTLVEVKTTQYSPEFKLSQTSQGRQLSEPWTHHRLIKVAAEHPDPNTRHVAKLFLEQAPSELKRELHGLAVQSDKYMILNVDEAGRVAGVKSEGTLTGLLKSLATKGKTPQTRAAAITHLAQLDQLKASSNGLTAESSVITRAESDWFRRVNGQSNSKPTSRTWVVEGDTAAARRTFVTSVLRQPGVVAGGLTFVVDETLTAWELHEGSIGAGEFQDKSARNGTKAAIVGMATQLVYFLAPTPHGIVIVAVGVVAYVGADHAIAAYDKTFVPNALLAADLVGIISDKTVATPTIDDIRAGRGTMR